MIIKLLKPTNIYSIKFNHAKESRVVRVNRANSDQFSNTNPIYFSGKEEVDNISKIIIIVVHEIVQLFFIRSLSQSFSSTFGSSTSLFASKIENATSTSSWFNLSLEDIRIIIKQFLLKSIFGILYNDLLILISIGSSIEYMYQTYLNPSNPSDLTKLNYLNYLEKGLATLFMFDWVLNFFIADHKIIFMTR